MNSFCSTLQSSGAKHGEITGVLGLKQLQFIFCCLAPQISLELQDSPFGIFVWFSVLVYTDQTVQAWNYIITPKSSACWFGLITPGQEKNPKFLLLGPKGSDSDSPFKTVSENLEVFFPFHQPPKMGVFRKRPYLHFLLIARAQVPFALAWIPNVKLRASTSLKGDP